MTQPARARLRLMLTKLTRAARLKARAAMATSKTFCWKVGRGSVCQSILPARQAR
jgi:hypothetical protein